MNMNKRDLKKLTKSQLIKLLFKQEKNGQSKKNRFHVQVLIIKNHQNKRNEDPQNPLENHHYPHYQRPLSTLTMTYSKPKTKVLKNSKSLAYKADKIRNSKVSQMNSKLKSLKNWTMLKKFITYVKNQ